MSGAGDDLIYLHLRKGGQYHSYALEVIYDHSGWKFPISTFQNADIVPISINVDFQQKTRWTWACNVSEGVGQMTTFDHERAGGQNFRKSDHVVYEWPLYYDTNKFLKWVIQSWVWVLEVGWQPPSATPLRNMYVLLFVSVLWIDFERYSYTHTDPNVYIYLVLTTKSLHCVESYARNETSESCSN